MSVMSGIFAAQREAILRDLRVAFPARVEAYDAARQAVRVQPLIRDFYENEEGNLATERLPVISDVPVLFPSGGGYFLTLPLIAGDVGLVVCTDRSLDRWLSAGGEVDAGDVRCHHLTDGVFLPGLYPFGGPRTGVSTTSAQIAKQGGLSVSVGATHVGLGEENPADFVAMASKVEDAINDLWSAMGTHTHSITGGTANPSGAVGAAGSLGSTTVKVKG
jgi:hypothetical protein